VNGVVFPGQGTQRTGMGERFHHLSARARAMYDEASSVLGRDVTELCFRGTPDELRDTRNAQVAVVVTNLAAYELLVESGRRADIVAGHSVGELSALAVAGCLDLAEVVLTVRERASLMSAVEVPGTMAAVTGLDADRVEALCSEADETVVAAAYNSLTNTVVSGTSAGVAAVVEGARRSGGRVSPLPVSHAFHSPLMAPALAAWDQHVRGLTFRDPHTPIVTNVSGTLTRDGQEIRQAIIDQLTKAVQWRRTMSTFRAARVETVIEAGHSRFLTGLARDTADAVPTVSLLHPRTLAGLLSAGVRP
jgi:[acyl-carrier-protein] S-malonyltransferase